jgi:hypothetical protein
MISNHGVGKRIEQAAVPLVERFHRPKGSSSNRRE